LWIIWHAIIWTIWQARNNIIFQNKVNHVDELVAEIIVLSWRWSLSRLNMQTYLYYERNWNPQEVVCDGSGSFYCCCFSAEWAKSQGGLV